MSTTITIQLTTPEAVEEAKIVQDECTRIRARLRDISTPPVDSAAINFILESITEHAISRSKEMTALFLEDDNLVALEPVGIAQRRGLDAVPGRDDRQRVASLHDIC